MYPTLHDVLKDVFPGVLEDLAFMFADELEEPGPLAAPEAVATRMGFHGHREGAMALAAPRALGIQIAANVLGVDAQSSWAMQGAEDALCELLNVTCGHVLTACAGDTFVLDLDPPSAEPCNAAGWAAIAASAGCVAFRVDDSPVLLSLTFVPADAR